MSKYRKAIIAALGVAVAIATKHWGPDAEIVADLELVATAVGVYFAPNTA